MAAAPDGSCGDAAIYLLGLLDEHQTQRFREHAEQCAVCRDELGALQPAVDLLPATVPQLAAPTYVKRRVMAAVRAESGQMPASANRALVTVRRPARGAPRWLKRRSGARRAALAFSAAGLLAGGVVIGAHYSGGAGTTPRVVSAEVTIAGASALLHESAGHNWLTIAGLPQPRGRRVYEVWVKRRGGPPQSTSTLFEPTNGGRATAAVPSGLDRASEVMVTQEPAGGSALPTSAPVVVARVS